MEIYYLKMLLLSDTTFGRGDGVAGLIDQEVEHDANGFPYLRGRTLKGLLSEECDNLIAVLSEPPPYRWEQATEHLFGIPGSTLETISKMHVGDACLPQDLRKAVKLQLDQEQERERIHPDRRRLTEVDILASLTTIRRQTAIDPEDGAPVEHSLRSSRVILRDLCFTAPLLFEKKPTPDMLALLAVSTLALQRVGSGRNRGRGHVRCMLHNSIGEEITREHFRYFEQETRG
ncbi:MULTISPECIES: RAMP superfamily CRISPR-associated protein [unclassified Nostoc]|uniref:RAMP superfamily CRISPR-associated protein n=1 Tax=unclassified Nostoc TaxID=2593658 RepID=UPI002AD38149|nr:RAMP superfamily CRISPR-associated protein [Nostoc sp. DedQUE03]MDZ7972171.1 RAMP superfamily protein [Nostoc sp. DedQUE03]MDZ8047160.1 RAMP superfamily protein [Nostoc sp. DedQUE02]